MLHPPQTAQVLLAGDLQFNLRSGEIRKEGKVIEIQELPSRALELLLQHPGEVVTRDQLRKALWPGDVFVDFQHSINTAIKRLRQSIGDSADNPKYIETVGRRGYRFIAPVETRKDHPAPQPGFVPRFPAEEVAPRLPLRRAALIGSALIAVAAALTFGFLQLRSGWAKQEPLGPIRSLAVLPLENLSDDTSQDYFAEGMTDELITELGQISGLRVISRTSMAQYKGVHKPLYQIGRELNVEAVVEGTILRSGDRVRITAQVVDARADKHLWAQSFNGDLRDILALQSQVASAIAQHIRFELTSRSRLRATKAVNPRAYQALLKGRYFAEKRTADSIRKSIAYLEESTHEDQDFAPAYAALSEVYALESGYLPVAPRDAYIKAKLSAERAVQIDSALAEAHTALGLLAINLDYDWSTSEEEFKRAIELNPGDANAHHWHAFNLVSLGKPQAAVEEIEVARQLDPLSIIINANAGLIFYLARQFDRAIAADRRALELDTNNPVTHSYLGLVYLQKGTYPAAITELRRAVELSGRSSAFLGQLAYAYAAGGNRAEASRIVAHLRSLSKHEYVVPCNLAVAYVGLGHTDEALSYLEKAVTDRSDCVLLVDPIFDSIRFDSRFRNILARVGLPMAG
jgi:TolB-like protein/DNA-binding winged helix-turn-helix (wHTH) protein/Flp pilus assembly protein TadD